MTRLERGRNLVRSVPSKSHDARKSKVMVVELDHTMSLPMIRLRPKGKKTGYEITVDGLYDLLVKANVLS